jgi:hypothetical protein
MRQCASAQRGTGIAIAALAALLASGCGTFIPPEYEQQVQWNGGYGRASLGGTFGGFFGNIEDVGPGAGIVVEIPPLYPIAFVGSVAAAVVIAAPLWIADVALDADGELAGEFTAELADAIFSGTAQSGALRSGSSDPRQLILSDWSLEMQFALTRHPDERDGGTLTYSAIMLGARVGGNRRIWPRPYLCGGYGWYFMDYTSSLRSNATVGGPWAGAGLEFFTNPHLSLALDLRSHFYFGSDNANEILDGGMIHGGVLMCMYW